MNYGVVQAFFGGNPPADGEALLRRYLDTLCERYRPLALGRLLTRERSGDERTTTPPLPLRAVYTALATDARVRCERFNLTFEELDKAITAADPDRLAPDQIRFPVAELDELHEVATMLRADVRDAPTRSLREIYGSLRRGLPRTSGSKKQQRVSGHWYEPELAVAALAPPRSRIVLLGDPGSGKSTVLRYLVVCIAEALLSGATTGPADLRGWTEVTLPVPIFCPLGPVAKALDDDPDHDLERLETAVLRSVYREGSPLAGLRDRLFQAWSSGSVLLCFDGLDEISGTLETTRADELSRRERLAVALHRLAQEVGDARVVVTCRTRPYEQDRAWQLPEPWQVRRIEPFALGQVRFFVEQWYTQSCAAPGATLSADEGQARAAELLRAIPAKPGLRDVCHSPLLLTMVVLLHYNQKQLPDERAEVYEELVSLLLDRWEWVRSSEREQVKLVPFGDRLGLPKLRARDLRTAVNELAYEAHRIAQDGRGVIPEGIVYDLLKPHVQIAIDPADPDRVKKSVWTAKVETFLELLVEESGLIQPDADGNYVLPHLTFEEYLAACSLAERQYIGLELAYARWSEGADRWREPMLLLMGCLRRENKHAEAKHWLDLLLNPVFGTAEKTRAQQQRDAVLAAACYADLGGRGYLRKHHHERTVQAFEDSLQIALVDLLEQPDPANLLPLRLEAGQALGRLGDPRFPVDSVQWIEQLAQRNEQFGEPSGYFCYMPQGTYRIGGWDGGKESAELSLQSFWIARLPITVAQYAPFVEQGYGRDAERWWTPNGWRWKQDRTRTQPYRWGQPSYNGANQPVTGVTWYEATAYCAWLTELLKEQMPTGYLIRLPTEAEWETTASFDGTSERCVYPWGNAEPTTELAIYDAAKLNAAAPVGSCPAGAAACGALDLAGNVWEYTASNHADYPGQSTTGAKDFTTDEWDVPLRGGLYYQDSTYVRCGARIRLPPVYDSIIIDDFGFRIVVAPPLGHSQ